MNVEFSVEEVQAMALYVVEQVGGLDGFSKADRAALKRWQNDALRVGSPSMKVLADKVNAELQRIHESAHVSPIQKPDWL